MLDINEKKMFASVRKGDEQAFGVFYKKYQPRLFAFCYGIIGDEEAAKDIVQESFITFWESRNVIQVDYSVISYLFKIAHSRCCRYLRRCSVKSNFSDLSELELNEIELAFYNEDKNITSSIYFKEMEDAYEKAVEKLPKQCQMVFIMSQKEEMKSNEIADKLSLSLRTVENHLYRATKFIRDEMKQYASFILSIFVFLS